MQAYIIKKIYEKFNFDSLCNKLFKMSQVIFKWVQKECIYLLHHIKDSYPQIKNKIIKLITVLWD